MTLLNVAPCARTRGRNSTGAKKIPPRTTPHAQLVEICLGKSERLQDLVRRLPKQRRSHHDLGGSTRELSRIPRHGDRARGRMVEPPCLLAGENLRSFHRAHSSWAYQPNVCEQPRCGNSTRSAPGHVTVRSAR